MVVDLILAAALALGLGAVAVLWRRAKVLGERLLHQETERRRQDALLADRVAHDAASAKRLQRLEEDGASPGLSVGLDSERG